MMMLRLFILCTCSLSYVSSNAMDGNDVMRYVKNYFTWFMLIKTIQYDSRAQYATVAEDIKDSNSVTDQKEITIYRPKYSTEQRCFFKNNAQAACLGLVSKGSAFTAIPSIEKIFALGGDNS